MHLEPGSGLKQEEVKRRHILPKALVVGLVTGLLASAFRIALQFAEDRSVGLLTRLTGWERLGVGIALGAIGGGIGVWLVRRFAPEASGSGIPHLKSVVLGEAELRWARVLPIKFLGGLSSIAGGFALGREGPTIQMGGATGLMVSTWFRVKPGEGERKALISAGAGAGLAAAFNAPLAGLIFVLEELHASFTPVIFVATFLAAVTADIVCRVLTGDTPVFSLHGMPSPSLQSLPVAVLVGCIAGFGGVLFNRCLLGSLDAFDRVRKWPPFATGAMAGVVVGIAAAIYPGIGGGGGNIAEHAIMGGIALKWIVVLGLARFLLTMVSYGSGAAGGFFAPLLAIGSLAGLAIGTIAHKLAPGWAAFPSVFAVLGMGALLTAIVRAPLTGIVLMIELTGSYDFMLPLLASCFAAYGVAEALRSEPIYESLRLRARQKAAALENAAESVGATPRT